MNVSPRRVALIYNPASGHLTNGRAAAVRDATSIFRDAGFQVEIFETDGPGAAAVQARECVDQGFHAIIACGGDGTVHEVLQPLVGTSVALGVLPLGTANALAADLNLVIPAADAARALVQASSVRIPVGRIRFCNRDGQPDSRYFVVAAGIGADALLMSRLDSRLKRLLGYALYLIEAFRIWATDPLPLFEANFAKNGNGFNRPLEVSQLLAVRVRSFGGVLRELAPGASLRSPKLNLIAFSTRSRLQYLRFLLAVVASRHTFNGSVQLHESETVECNPSAGSHHPVYVEADGEVLGSLPVQIDVVPDAVNLLVPPGAEP